MFCGFFSPYPLARHSNLLSTACRALFCSQIFEKFSVFAGSLLSNHEMNGDGNRPLQHTDVSAPFDDAALTAEAANDFMSTWVHQQQQQQEQLLFTSISPSQPSSSLSPSHAASVLDPLDSDPTLQFMAAAIQHHQQQQHQQQQEQATVRQRRLSVMEAAVNAQFLASIQEQQQQQNLDCHIVDQTASLTRNNGVLDLGAANAHLTMPQLQRQVAAIDQVVPFISTATDSSCTTPGVDARRSSAAMVMDAMVNASIQQQQQAVAMHHLMNAVHFQQQQQQAMQQALVASLNTPSALHTNASVPTLPSNAIQQVAMNMITATPMSETAQLTAAASLPSPPNAIPFSPSISSLNMTSTPATSGLNMIPPSISEMSFNLLPTTDAARAAAADISSTSVQDSRFSREIQANFDRSMVENGVTFVNATQTPLPFIQPEPVLNAVHAPSNTLHTDSMTMLTQPITSNLMLHPTVPIAGLASPPTIIPTGAALATPTVTPLLSSLDISNFVPSVAAVPHAPSPTIEVSPLAAPTPDATPRSSVAGIAPADTPFSTTSSTCQTAVLIEMDESVKAVQTEILVSLEEKHSKIVEVLENISAALAPSVEEDTEDPNLNNHGGVQGGTCGSIGAGAPDQASLLQDVQKVQKMVEEQAAVIEQILSPDDRKTPNNEPTAVSY
jgi:hypothetical protein